MKILKELLQLNESTDFAAYLQQMKKNQRATKDQLQKWEEFGNTLTKNGFTFTGSRFEKGNKGEGPMFYVTNRVPRGKDNPLSAKYATLAGRHAPGSYNTQELHIDDAVKYDWKTIETTLKRLAKSNDDAST